MIKKKTVLVLGAGASMPFGFPSGQGLVDLILRDTLKWFSKPTGPNILSIGSKEDFVDFVQKLREADTPSIDIFLEAHPELHPLGKAAIAIALRPLEETENLKEAFGQRRLLGQILGRRERERAEWLSDIYSANNWYQYLFYSKLWDSFENFNENNLSIITFNYDRSFEQYMFTSLTAMAPENTPEEEIIEKMKAIKIIHPHGKLGPLEWETNEREKRVPYGSALDGFLIMKANENIKILSDETAEENFKDAHEELESAERIYFLGFGFDETNVRRLLPVHIRRKLLLGTSCGLSPHQIAKMIDLGIESMETPAHFPEKKVFDYLYNYEDAVLD